LLRALVRRNATTFAGASGGQLAVVTTLLPRSGA
jgi:hypothetical protein